MTTPPRILGEARDYAQFAAVVRAWLEELKVAGETVDELAGLPIRYTSKALGVLPAKGFGRTSLGPLLGALGLKLIIAVDVETLERMRRRLPTRERVGSQYARGTMLAGRKQKKRTKRGQNVNSDHAKALRARQLLITTPRQRSAIAKRAARARWHKPRVVEITDRKQVAAIRAADTSPAAGGPSVAPQRPPRSAGTAGPKRPKPPRSLGPRA